jgi:hypothetical protein
MKITQLAVLAAILMSLGLATAPAKAFDGSTGTGLYGYIDTGHGGWGDRRGRGDGDYPVSSPRRGYGDDFGHGYRLGWHELRRAVRAQGFRRIHDIEPRGPHYRMNALDHRGRLVRLRVNGFNGSVMAVRVIGGGWGGGWGGGYDTAF